MPEAYIYIGDCLEILPRLDAGSVHLTVTDPAYESLERHRAKGTTTRLKDSKASSNPWFKTFPNRSYFELFAQIYKVQAQHSHCYVFCDSETEHVILSARNPYDARLDAKLQDYMKSRAIQLPPTMRAGWTAWPSLCWVKTTKGSAVEDAGMLDETDIRSGMGYHWRRSEERILFLEKGKRKLNELGWKNVLLGPRAGKGDPPTMKPVQVIEKLILNSSQPGEVVLDVFMGSGTTLIAALGQGRSAMGIEIDRDSALDAAERIVKATGIEPRIIETSC